MLRPEHAPSLQSATVHTNREITPGRGESNKQEDVNFLPQKTVRIRCDPFAAHPTTEAKATLIVKVIDSTGLAREAGPIKLPAAERAAFRFCIKCDFEISFLELTPYDRA